MSKIKLAVKYNIDAKDYYSQFSLEQRKEAFDYAVEHCKQEIDRFWTRSTYFWAFITSIYVAYYNVFKDICNKQHGSLYLVSLSFLGMFFSLAFYLSSKGSKFWQENWEHHINMLEDEIMGPLTKIFKTGSSFSVSKISMSCGFIIFIFGKILFFYEVYSLVFKYSFSLKTKIIVFALICSIALLITITFVIYSIGNSKKNINIYFDRLYFSKE